MTLTIDLNPDVEAGLAALAAEQGMEMVDYIRHLLEERIPSRDPTSLTPDQKAAIWRGAARVLPRTRPLSDEAVSRESMYDTRG